ncbi:MAG: 16S rRNA (adenine(1518)-N(6)/adenine(1519)-N(6))-dimethyltransferase [Candidatus Methylumidiphilus alinenensis]|uniref:Ribosomal RNA small subunit methyltransferase A n=1 Tax=Candidatus Methylumidiphilus alinenensis TaxID=2202197 RepID=A0A2W4SVH3_9GAMM|nr:MAG: 16S rRNA (adenine(1518)-N(6)/adenine(1519)-N(6))-dimethyltransferase [Candidatus Methylumidiphilus alinenensis]
MNHKPRKRFGQNFLTDERVVHGIVSAISPRADEQLVEIGPGLGALTRWLLQECGRLDVVELDRDLVEVLRAKFAAEEKLHIHSADALKFDFSSLADGGRRLRVIGNLPYNISTPLLFHLFDQSACIKDMHFMLQKEVVERLCAEPGEKEYGRLSVMARYYCDMEPLMDVYPESFNPQPKIISSVIRLVPHDKKPVSVAPDILNRVVAAAFSQRRKTLRNALSTLFTSSEIESLGLDPGTRAERLSLGDYGLLAELLLQKTASEGGF